MVTRFLKRFLFMAGVTFVFIGLTASKPNETTSIQIGLAGIIVAIVLFLYYFAFAGWYPEDNTTLPPLPLVGTYALAVVMAVVAYDSGIKPACFYFAAFWMVAISLLPSVIRLIRNFSPRGKQVTPKDL
jgi:cytochrome c oxidase assembly factor CtaG